MPEIANLDDVASPCTQHCRLSTNGRVCMGCFRLLEEIGRWSACSLDERRAIVTAARQRRHAARMDDHRYHA